MTITTFRKLYGDNAITIPLSSIILSENCHKKAFRKNKAVRKLDEQPMCIVRS